jgi:hypothetical protein
MQSEIKFHNSQPSGKTNDCFKAEAHPRYLLSGGKSRLQKLFSPNLQKLFCRLTRKANPLTSKDFTTHLGFL